MKTKQIIRAILTCFIVFASYGMLCEKIDEFGGVGVTIELRTNDITLKNITTIVKSNKDQKDLWQDTIISTDSIVKYLFSYVNSIDGVLIFNIILDSTGSTNLLNDSIQINKAVNIYYKFIVANSGQDIASVDKQHNIILNVGNKIDTIFYSKIINNP
jgi:hypothetical protein